MFRAPTVLVALAASVVALLVSGCYTGPSAEHFQQVVADVRVPETWVLANDEVRSPDGEDPCDPLITDTCPSASRSFTAARVTPLEAFDILREAAETAGFTVEPDPDAHQGGPACRFSARRGTDALVVSVWGYPRDAGLGDRPFGEIAVVVTSHR